MKTFILLFLTSTCFAGPLDILDAGGNLDGRFGRTSSAESTNSEISLEVSQGIRFVGAPWIEPYIGFTKYEQFDASNTEWVSFGVKNKTFLPPFTFGIEYRSMLAYAESTPSNFTVAYVSVYKEWNLIKGKRSKDE